MDGWISSNQNYISSTQGHLEKKEKQ